MSRKRGWPRDHVAKREIWRHCDASRYGGRMTKSILDDAFRHHLWATEGSSMPAQDSDGTAERAVSGHIRLDPRHPSTHRPVRPLVRQALPRRQTFAADRGGRADGVRRDEDGDVGQRGGVDRASPPIWIPTWKCSANRTGRNITPRLGSGSRRCSTTARTIEARSARR